MTLAKSVISNGQFAMRCAMRARSKHFLTIRVAAASSLAQRCTACERRDTCCAARYGMVVLERLEDALRRGAKPQATIAGCGESADAHHLTQPHPEGDGAARAIGAALADANLAPADIDLVAAHATGTPDNDAGE